MSPPSRCPSESQGNFNTAKERTHSLSLRAQITSWPCRECVTGACYRWGSDSIRCCENTVSSSKPSGSSDSDEGIPQGGPCNRSLLQRTRPLASAMFALFSVAMSVEFFGARTTGMS